MISTRGTKYAYEGVAEQAGSSSSVEVTVNYWQEQVDGVRDKWRTRVKRKVRLG